MRNFGEFYRLSQLDKQDIFRQVATKIGLPDYAIEKDWWVSLILKLLFSLKIKDHLVFKGGTSLSKAWGLIDRFSEDIDLGLDRSFLGFSEQYPRKKEITRLRKTSRLYILNTLLPAIEESFSKLGIDQISIQALTSEDSDQDPIIIQINYASVTSLSII